MTKASERKTNDKVWNFVESPLVWGGLGLLGGAIVVLIPPVGLKYIFGATWMLVVIAQLKERFWCGRRWLALVGNAGLIVFFGILFLVGWHYIPKPKEPLSPEEQAKLTANELITLLPPFPQDRNQETSLLAVAPHQKPLAPESAFFVAVETRLFTIPGGRYGTSFWTASLAPGGCALQSVQAALFMRIVNLQKDRTLITNYTVEAMGFPLPRIKMNLYKPFVILGKGILKPSNQPGTSAEQFPVPQGGIGSMVRFPIDEAYPAEARPVVADFLDVQLAGHYLEHKQMARGWVFFHYPNQGIFPSRLVVKIQDETGHNYSYPIPDTGSDQNADAMSRTVSVGPTVDLSACPKDPS